MYPSTKLPGATKMTIAEVARKATGAVGMYQNLPEYLVARAKAVKLDPNKDLYNEENQRKIAVYLIEKGQAGVTPKMLKDNPDDAMIRLAKVWAAIPVPKNMQGHRGSVRRGQSYYSGVGSNKAHITPEMMYKAMGASVKLQEQAQSKPTGGTTTAGGGSNIPTQSPSSRPRGEGSKLAGELGRFLDSKGLGSWGSGTHQHPEHPAWPPESGHSAGSLHYRSQGARALDIGGFGPNLYRSSGFKGVDDQTKILAGIAEFNKKKGAKPVELLKEGYPGHANHVHVAYFRGGPTKEGPAKLHNDEFVTDADSTEMVGMPFMNILNSIETVKGFVQKVPELIQNLTERYTKLSSGMSDNAELTDSSTSINVDKLVGKESAKEAEQDQKEEEKKKNAKLKSIQDKEPPTDYKNIPPDVDSSGKPILPPPSPEGTDSTSETVPKYKKGGEIIPKGVRTNISNLEQFTDYNNPSGSYNERILIQPINIVNTISTPSNDGSNPTPSISGSGYVNDNYQSLIR
jgi:hypothetical protein